MVALRTPRALFGGHRTDRLDRRLRRDLPQVVLPHRTARFQLGRLFGPRMGDPPAAPVGASVGDTRGGRELFRRRDFRLPRDARVRPAVAEERPQQAPARDRLRTPRNVPPRDGPDGRRVLVRRVDEDLDAAVGVGWVSVVVVVGSGLVWSGLVVRSFRDARPTRSSRRTAFGGFVSRFCSTRVCVPAFYEPLLHPLLQLLLSGEGLSSHKRWLGLPFRLFGVAGELHCHTVLVVLRGGGVPANY
mmetsp:Transcript_8470/g.20255  ORF Transcript_8470/g.20255 Transcript_8470/m.20255 type:complete len:245 (+) Transcript_8470:884-1618(+)